MRTQREIRRESYFHTAIVKRYLERNTQGSEKHNEELKELLGTYGSFEAAYEGLQRRERRSTEKMDEVVKRLGKCEFGMITINEEEFPEKLKGEGLTPVIYYQGDLGLLSNPGMAVVGTRELSDEVDRREGKRITERWIDEGRVIVSGLALGCDTLAHETALEYNGGTIAVLGTAIDKTYPKATDNNSLQKRIIERGLVISEYPIGSEDQRAWWKGGGQFANRNRTTVGLADIGITVIRAGDKSGTQHAIKAAIGTGKKVYILENNQGKGYKWIERITKKSPLLVEIIWREDG